MQKGMFRKGLVLGIIVLLVGVSIIFPCECIKVEKRNLTTSGLSSINFMYVYFQSGKYNLYGEIFYPSNESQIYPGIIFCEGFSGYATPYRWIPETLAKEGYVVMIFDFPGQGKSEGIFPIPYHSIRFYFGIYLRFTALVEIPIYEWTSVLVKATSDAITYLAEESPLQHLVNKSNIGLIGHSLGGKIVTSTASQDNRVDAVVSLSQSDPISISIRNISVPIQFQCGTFDLLTRSIPNVLYCYHKAHSPKELIAIEHGTHTGFVNLPYPRWQKDICFRYTVGWFDYFLKNKQEAFKTITTGTNHLSKFIRSRYNFGEGDRFLT